MKAIELLMFLKEHIERHPDKAELNILVELNYPSLGEISSSKVINARLGFDWDRDFILSTEEPLVIKTNNEKLYDNTFDLIYMLARYDKRKRNGLYKPTKLAMKCRKHLELAGFKIEYPEDT
jgi:hypothetical protein